MKMGKIILEKRLVWLSLALITVSLIGLLYFNSNNLTPKAENTSISPTPKTAQSSFGTQNITKSTFSQTYLVGWNMISLPYVVNQSPTDIFPGLDLTNILFRYNQAANRYDPFNYQDPSSFGNINWHDGFWLYLDANKPKTFTYVPTDVASPAIINLPVPGWHMIGFGPDEQSLINNSMFKIRNKSTNESLPFNQAAAKGWVSNPMFYYNPQELSYESAGFEPDMDTTNRIFPGKGYWMHTREPNLETVITILSPPPPPG
jgi:hypothetical protein